MTDVTYVPVSDGIEAIGQHVQQLIDRDQGTTYVASTPKNNSANPTSTFQNVGTGSMIKCVNSAGTTVFEVTQTGATLLQVGISYSPETYGAVADCNFLNNGGTMTVGSALLTANTGVFTVLDTGKTIGVQGAGSGGATLVGTMTYVTSTQVTLSTNASTAISSAEVVWGTDNTSALNAAWQAAILTGGEIVGKGRYLAGNLNWSSGRGVVVRGLGVGATTSGTYGTMRGMCIIARPGTTGNWIDWSGSSRCLIQNVQFGYSEQGDFATPVTGILAAGYSGSATEDLWLDDVYISGKYSKNSMLFNAAAICGARRSQFYNYYSSSSASTFATAMAVSASNWSSTSSAFGTVNTIGSWNETKSFSFRDCEFHDQSGYTGGATLTAATGASTTIPLFLDGVQGVQLYNCSIDGGGFGIKIKDADTTPARVTRLVTVKGSRFNPYIAGTYTMAAALINDVAQAQPQVELDHCYFNTTQAWAGSTTTATSAAGFDRLTIKDCYSVGAATSAVILVASSSNTRLTACWIDCAGLSLGLNGKADARTFLLSVNAINGAVSSADAGYNLSTNGFGNFRINGGINDNVGASMLAFVPAATAVNYLEILNAASGSSPELRTNGNDAGVNLNVRPKGGGSLVMQTGGILITAGTFTASGTIASTGGYLLPGVAGSAGGAVVSGAAYTNNVTRGWVKFPTATTGTSVTALTSFNLSGGTVARTTAGDYLITWSTASPSANYCAQITVQSDGATHFHTRVVNTNTTTTATRIIITDSAGTNTDIVGSWIHVEIKGG